MSEFSVELSEVEKRFGSTLALNRVTLRVPQGSCFGLIGPNGAGKTTAFSLICGYLKPTQGEVRVFGADPRHPGSLKRKVGVLPQDAMLPPGVSVGVLLRAWAQVSGLMQPEAEAKGALARVGMESAWESRTDALSHGMAKRVSLAQALMGSPPLLLFDEPTAGLDPKVAAQIRQLIREIRGKQTIVISSHNLHELEELCDIAAILDRGALVQVGSMSELTSVAAEFRVQIARGDVPLARLRAIPGCTGAELDPSGSLLVRFQGEGVPPEEMITAVLTVLVNSGVLILGVSRGRKLEERVLQLT